MKKTILYIFLLLFTISGKAYENRNLLEKTADKTTLSGLLLQPQEWVAYPQYADRKGWDDFLGKNKAVCIAEGEKFLAYQWKVVKATDYLEYSRSGNRANMEAVYKSNLKAISSLFVAELAEGKGRFTDQLINGVFQACEMTTWSLSAHLPLQRIGGTFPDDTDQVIELVSGEVGSMFSWIYYFMSPQFDKVNPLISKRLYKEIDERIMTPYLRETRFWWMATNYDGSKGLVNNWNPWCNSNVLQCFLLLEKDRSRLTDAVYKTMVSVDKFINYTNDDGACEEGPSYWGHAAGKMFDYLQLLYKATDGKVSIFEQPMIKNMGEYISRSSVGNGWVVNFADASAKGDNDYHLIFRYGNMIHSTEMEEFASYLKKNFPVKIYMDRDAYRMLENLACDSHIDKYKAVHDNAAFTWYPQTEFCYMSSGRLFLAAKGGHNNESHNHNDVGTFSLYVDQKPVLIDAGVGTYNKKTFSNERYTIWTMQSSYHNLPSINGFMQEYGKEYRSRNVKADKSKKVFSLDMAGAYPAEAGIRQWQRTYKLHPASLDIEDVFDIASAKTSNQLNFLTWGKVDISDPGKIMIDVLGQKISLLYDKKLFEAKVETINLDDSRLSDVWGASIHRISLDAKAIANKGKYRLTVKI